MATTDAYTHDGAATAAPGPSQLYTCMSCLVGFHSPIDQRTHYRSDLHRYNMKRQVAGLPPVRQDVFEQKVQQQGQGQHSETVSNTSAGEKQQRPRCQACAKSFASGNAYTSHVNSKKHKEAVAVAVAAAAAKPAAATSAAPAEPLVNAPMGSADAGADPLLVRIPASALSSVKDVQAALPNTMDTSTEASQSTSQVDDAAEPFTSSTASTSSATAPEVPTSLTIAAEATDEEVEAAIAARLASSARVDPSKQCIFCPTTKFDDLASSLAHMQRSHGFFLPEQPYITDMPGLVQYLADKVTVGHLCLYCNGRGRGFNTAEAARKHMLDKNHCKIAYDRDEDRLELGDFYDFSSSYPDYQGDAGEGGEGGEGGEDDEEWEDEDADGDGDGDDTEMEGSDDESDLPPSNGIRYGDSELELVLPSGARLGHRSLARYYRQTLFSTPASAGNTPAATAGAGGAVARRLIDAGRHAGSGADLVVRDRQGGEVRARNRGEAKEAKRHIREFRDMKRREDYKTAIAYRNNNQKHFRDPLLQ